ncbi:galectin-8 isoform X1 [Lagenorhynchus albirostris]|uniref:galectin-8 isoform X1 n=1 Tax=Lagenorhynchus albirostris TaxID=27610 RepID=UPI0028E6CF58|nr:galectin-8 isoform X1 [Lagenorhynchus albirostris]
MCNTREKKMAFQTVLEIPFQQATGGPSPRGRAGRPAGGAASSGPATSPAEPPARPARRRKADGDARGARTRKWRRTDSSRFPFSPAHARPGTRTTRRGRRTASYAERDASAGVSLRAVAAVGSSAEEGMRCFWPRVRVRRAGPAPIIPYVGTISEQLEPGTLIVLRGHVPSDSDRFQVDLQCGSSVKPRADAAFHFNPRFRRANCIVCNTLKNEKWGREEITYDMPFSKEKSFEIVIMVLKDKFQVAVNGKHTLIYAHRISLEKIDTLGIYGKVIIHSVGFSFSSDLRSSQASTLEWTKISEENVQKSGMSQFTLPFVARLNSSMGPGRTVVVKGEVNTNAKGFAVDLLSGKSRDIALHLNPRLNVKAFVRNSFLQESWGEEERNITCFPFSPGMYFEMIIYCDVREFKVAVNGVHSLEYRHRFKDLSHIDTLEIDGDIHLLEVRSW